MPSSCGSFSLVADDAAGHTWVIPFRCGSWACPDCGPVKKAKLLRRLQPSPANLFITLTCDPARYDSPSLAFAQLRDAFQCWIKRIRRHVSPSALEYFAVWETTAAGWPHLHVLTRGPFIPPSVVREHWAALTGAYVIDLQTVKNVKNVAPYLAKYLTKELTAPPGFHRYMASANYLLEPDSPDASLVPPGLHWEIMPVSAASYRIVAEYSGVDVDDLGGGVIRLHKRCKKGAACSL